jgi:Ca-activated chloride channel family protein
MLSRRVIVFTLAAAAALTGLVHAGSRQDRAGGQGFSFHSGVDLVNVAVTVTDASGRFVSGLNRDDFVVYEDGKPQPISQFDSDRVPVSLGIALDTSGSMAGPKIASAEAALDRFLFDLLGPSDQVFLYRFSGQPELVHGWTSDRRAVADALGNVHPNGGTAMYDTIAEAIPLAQSGTARKKALVIITDGMDTSSRTTLAALGPIIRESEVLVYAIGIDASSGETAPASSSAAPASRPVPSPFPGQRPPAASSPAPSTPAPASRASRGPSAAADVLRQITDESGGRTEIILSHRDLDPATARIADELSKQYFLGYVTAAPKDGKWHTIDVQVRRSGDHVRARKGFIAN